MLALCAHKDSRISFPSFVPPATPQNWTHLPNVDRLLALAVVDKRRDTSVGVDLSSLLSAPVTRRSSSKRTFKNQGSFISELGKEMLFHVYPGMAPMALSSSSAMLGLCLRQGEFVSRSPADQRGDRPVRRACREQDEPWSRGDLGDGGDGHVAVAELTGELREASRR